MPANAALAVTAGPAPQSSSSRLSGSSSDDALLGTEHSLPLASQPSISCCATLASSSCTALAAGPAACTDAPWPCSCSPVGTAPASSLLQLAPSTTVWRAAGMAGGATVASASQAPLSLQALCVGAAAWCACWVASASRAARLARLSSSTASTSASTSPAAWKQGYAHVAAMQVQPCTCTIQHCPPHHRTRGRLLRLRLPSGGEGGQAVASGPQLCRLLLLQQHIVWQALQVGIPALRVKAQGLTPLWAGQKGGPKQFVLG